MTVIPMIAIEWPLAPSLSTQLPTAPTSHKRSAKQAKPKQQRAQQITSGERQIQKSLLYKIFKSNPVQLYIYIYVWNYVII